MSLWIVQIPHNLCLLVHFGRQIPHLARAEIPVVVFGYLVVLAADDSCATIVAL